MGYDIINSSWLT